MANNRIFYASQAISLQGAKPDLSAVGTEYFPRGVQSVGISTTFGLEQVFQLGQINLYENVEDTPEVEVTISKVIDGTLPLYALAMCGNLAPSTVYGKELVELANNRVHFKLNIHSDADTGATGTPLKTVMGSGMYLSSVSYTIPVDGNATEDITLVGNNKIWTTGTPAFKAGEVPNETAPSIGRRYRFSQDGSSVPSQLPDGTGRLQSVTINTDLGRDAINELGRQSPYFRYVNFPVEVTSEFEVVATLGDNVEATEEAGTNCSFTPQLTDEPVFITMCGSGASDRFSIDLGDKNKLTSVNYTGGDTGGGNATVTYSYQTFNKLVLFASGTYVNTTFVDNN